MKNKFWEIEFFAFSFETGEVELISLMGYYIEAKTFQEAFFKLERERNPSWRLSGRWFNSEEEAEEIQGSDNMYEEITNPRNLVGNMNFDEFYEWLDLGTERDIRSALQEFKKAGLTEKIKMTEAYLKNKFGDEKKNNEGEEGSTV